MPARKKRLSLRKSNRLHSAKSAGKKDAFRKVPFFLLLFLLLLLAVFIKTFLSTRYWDPNGKLSVAVQTENGDVQLMIFDTELGEISEINIPGNVQVETAGDFGIWRVKSLWGLGENEKLRGEILVKTLTQHFRFPVYVWADHNLLRFLDKNPLNLAKIPFTPVSTNLSFGDIMRISIFSMSVANVERDSVNLTETNFIKKTKLKDGEEGYELSGHDSLRLYSKFNDNSLVRKTLRVVIRDGTGKADIAQNTGRILEVMGAKVSLITKVSDTADFYCEVHGNKNSVFQESVRKIALVLGCETKRQSIEGNFDIEIRLGRNFK